ncbi:MAG: DegV family protein, partial [Tissierellales bacterium]|nr:DegV family protein [Tissierellales bacterium]
KLPTTSQVSPGEFVEVFKEILDKDDEVLGIFLAKEFSGTLPSAKIAKDIIKSDKIHLIDSRGVTGALAAVVLAAGDLIQRGLSIENIELRLNEFIRNSESILVIDTLEYLVKGGRISKAQGAIGSVLSVKPVLTIGDGKLDTLAKVRGRKKGIKWMIDWVKDNRFDLSDKRVFILDTDDPKFHQDIKDALLENFEVGEIIDIEVGAVVGTHSGPGCGGICFINEKI